MKPCSFFYTPLFDQLHAESSSLPLTMSRRHSSSYQSERALSCSPLLGAEGKTPARKKIHPCHESPLGHPLPTRPYFEEKKSAAFLSFYDVTIYCAKSLLQQKGKRLGRITSTFIQ